MIQSGHNYAHVMTAQLSWHVQNYDLNAFFVNTLQQPVFYFDLDYHNINLSWNGNRDTTGLLSHPLCPLTRKWPATGRCQLTRIHHIVNSSQASLIMTGPWPWVAPPETCNRHTRTTPASLHLGLQSLLGLLMAYRDFKCIQSDQQSWEFQRKPQPVAATWKYTKPCYFTTSWRLMCTYITVRLFVAV